MPILMIIAALFAFAHTAFAEEKADVRISLSMLRTD